MVIRSRAPARIDFAGGWTDVKQFCQDTPGYVVNAAISLYSYVTVKRLETIDVKEYGYRTKKNSNGVRIYSADFDAYQEAVDIKDIEYDGSMDLIKAAVKRTELGGIDIVTRCDAPPGSGLGSSASMGVALCGALLQRAAKRRKYFPMEYAMIACQIEQEELGILGGSQDQLASAYGGINLMEFGSEGQAHVSKIPLDKNMAAELQKSLVLCYTGKSRLSGDIHSQVLRSYQNGQKTRNAIEALKAIAEDFSRALYDGNCQVLGELLQENWQNQKELHPSVTNADMDALYNLACDNGAQGGKACGAGGGGCMVFYAPDREHTVRKALAEVGASIIDFQFDFDGLEIWRLEDDYLYY